MKITRSTLIEAKIEIANRGFPQHILRILKPLFHIEVSKPDDPRRRTTLPIARQCVRSFELAAN